jgi:pimeloyl-ACP methyl ester carboxylesterase
MNRLMGKTAPFMKQGMRAALRFVLVGVMLCVSASARAAPEEKFADVDGARLRYLTEGKGDAVVLLHGFTHTADSWTLLMTELAKTHTVIAPDLPGLGKSSRPARGYDKLTAAQDIHKLLVQLGIAKADVVGHDIGLMVAYAYTGQFRDEVRRLVVMEAPLPGIEPWDQMFIDPRLWHFHFTSPTAEKLVAGRERIYLDRFWNEFAADPKAVPEKERQFYTKSYSQPGAMKASFAYFAAFRQDAADNKRLFATKLTMPVLTIAGDKSMGPALEAQAKRVAESVHSEVLSNTGHWLLNERPQETVKLISDFLHD